MPSPDICPIFCQILNVFFNVCQIMKYLFQQIVSKSEISSQAFQNYTMKIGYGPTIIQYGGYKSTVPIFVRSST